MPRFIILIYISLGLSIILVLHSCERTNPDFVSLKNGEFVCQHQPFFPLMINYVLDFRQIEGELRLAPNIEYENPTQYESENIAELEIECRGHLQIMKDMGFNSMRLCMDRLRWDEQGLYYPTDSAGTIKSLYLKESTKEILGAFELYVKTAAEMDMRIMWLIKPPIENEELWGFTEELLDRFSDDPTIFAYDFFNEPLYFDVRRQADKKNVIRLVDSWRSLMESRAPNQLFTLGLSEPIEVFRWDPSLLDVDFLSFHTYHPIRALSEVYWYSKYSEKPWMVGETGLQADGDSIPYEDQALYNQKIYDQVRNCGGMGIGFWEFQEVTYTNFEGNHTGLINRDGTTTSSDSAYTMQGTIKPAGVNIKHLEERRRVAPCEQPVNYYNMMGYSNFVLRGKLQNEKTEEPIEGAVIRGWNMHWDVGMNTFSNERGEFTLYTNDYPVHFEISAPGMSRLKFDSVCTFQSVKGYEVYSPFVPNRKLEYHDIDYNIFLPDSFPNGERDIFDFRPELFGNARLEGNIGVLYLRPIE